MVLLTKASPSTESINSSGRERNGREQHTHSHIRLPNRIQSIGHCLDWRNENTHLLLLLALVNASKRPLVCIWGGGEYTFVLYLS